MAVGLGAFCKRELLSLLQHAMQSLLLWHEILFTPDAVLLRKGYPTC